MSEELKQNEPEAAEDDDAMPCPNRKYCGRSSLCYPAHRCELLEGHTGKHQCDCGKTFYGGDTI